MGRLSLLAVVGMLAGCASTGGFTSAHHVRSNLDLGPWPYQIGPVTVILLESQPEVETVCRRQAALSRSPMTARPLGGCYFVTGGREYIVSIPEAGMLLHEFKHVFEGTWHK